MHIAASLMSVKAEQALPLYSFVLQCNFCACKYVCTVVVRFPGGGGGGWGTVTWQLSTRGWRGTVFPTVGQDKAGGRGGGGGGMHVVLTVW